MQTKQCFYRKPSWVIGYGIAVLCVLLWCILHWRTDVISTDLAELLPQHSTSQVQKIAEQRVTQALNNELLIVVSHKNHPEKALAFAQDLQQKWQKSGVFSQVEGERIPDLEQLQQFLYQQQLASIPEERWNRYVSTIKSHLQAQLKAFFSPFSAKGIVAPEKDWLGLLNQVQQVALDNQAIHWDMDTHWLFISTPEQKWWVMNASLSSSSSVVNAPTSLLSLVQQAEAQGRQQGVTVLVAGGALFAAENRQQGENEAKVMSAVGLSLTLCMLILLFRTWRLVTLLLPLIVGILMGGAVTWWWFGQIHLFVIVIGTSLVGILLDFPLHWLASSLTQSPWDKERMLAVSARVFMLSLVITVLGYIALAFAPLPILQQTAVFSTLALLFAFFTSLLWVPIGFYQWQARYSKKLKRLCQVLLVIADKLRVIFYHKIVVLCSVLALCLGLWKVNTQDDIRQWVSLSPKWLAQAQQVTALTQTHPSSQYFLLMASSDDELLQKGQQLQQQLQDLKEKRVLENYMILNQWVVPQSQQRERQQVLKQLVQDNTLWQELLEAGIDPMAIKIYQQGLLQLSPRTITESIQHALGRIWQPLYLGQVDEHHVAAIVRLFGIKDVTALAQLEDTAQQRYFVDQRGDLNQLFTHTRDIAILLKIASYVVAFVICFYFVGAKKASLFLGVPLLASLITISLFALLGWTLSLFAIFGLLLVTAIGTDYAIYMATESLTSQEKIAGVLLAMMTTMISFGVLGFSQTPAIAMFGRSVAIGVVFCFILALVLVLKRGKEDESAI